MKVSLIAAMSRNGVIGSKNKLPWKLSADLKRFKKLTEGHVVIMGRKTYESIGRPLPNRVNVVVTRQKSVQFPDSVICCHSIEEALDWAKENTFSRDAEVFIIGGSEIYRQSLSRVDRMYLTVIEKDFEGDTFFPEFDRAAFQAEEGELQLERDLPFRYLKFERDSGPSPLEAF